MNKVMFSLIHTEVINAPAVAHTIKLRKGEIQCKR